MSTHAQPRSEPAQRLSARRLVVVSRAVVVEDRPGARARMQSADGRLIDRLAASFGEVLVVAPVVRPRHQGAYRRLRRVGHRLAANVRVVELHEDFGGSIRVLPALGRVARQAWSILRVLRGADAAFVFMPSFRASAAALLCRALGVPLTLYLGTRWEETSRVRARLSGRRARLLPLYGRVAGFLEGRAMAAANARLVTGAALRRAYAHLPGPTVQTPPVVDFDLELLDAVLETAARRNGAPQAPTLLYLGSLMPGKNVDVVIGAVARLRRSHPGARLIVAGAGPEEERLRALAAERLPGPERCRFDGYLSDPARKLARYTEADALVLASAAEGFPRVIYEALAAGLPVVTTDLPGVRATLPEGSVETVARAEEQLLAEGIRRALLPERASAMVDAGRPAARSALSRDPAMLALELIEEQIGERPASAG